LPVGEPLDAFEADAGVTGLDLVGLVHHRDQLVQVGFRALPGVKQYYSVEKLRSIGKLSSLFSERTLFYYFYFMNDTKPALFGKVLQRIGL
jgi:hypothetical protein